MARFIVHIGDAKCGSSSIQRSLYEARLNLREHGVTYATATPRNGQYNLTTLVGGEIRGLQEHQLKLARDSVQMIRDSLRDNSGDTVLLSGESFFSLPPAKMIAILHEINPQIERLDIIAYVRPPESMYLSFVQQTLKGDSRFTLPNQYARRIDTVLQRWKASAEVNSITVRHFDRAYLVDGDAVADFESVLRTLTGQNDTHLPRFVDNTSLSAEQLVVLQQYRAQFLKEHDGKLHNKSGNVISYFEKLSRLGFPGSKLTLNDNSMASLHDGNARIIANLNQDFPELNFSSPYILRDARDDSPWVVGGGVEQILKQVDPEIADLLRSLIPDFQPHMTKYEICILMKSLRRVAQLHRLDYDNIAQATATLWRVWPDEAREKMVAEFLEQT
jgi:hypothetical protein